MTRSPSLAAAAAGAVLFLLARAAHADEAAVARPIDRQPTLRALGVTLSDEHVVVVADHALRAGPGGPILREGTGATVGPVPLTLLRSGRQLQRHRVLLLASGAFVAVHLEEDALGDLATRDLRLGRGIADAGRPGDGRAIGVHVVAGAPLRVEAGEEPVARAALAGGDLVASGTVRRAHLARSRRGSSSKLAGTFPSPNATVAGDVSFLDRPGGEVIARLAGSGGAVRPVRRIGAPREGHQRVLYRSSEAVVVGWVPVEAIEPGFPGGVLWGSVCCGAPGPGDKVRLREGTRLYAAPDGELVGLVTDDHEFERAGPAAGEWVPLLVQSELGALRVHARP